MPEYSYILGNLSRCESGRVRHDHIIGPMYVRVILRYRSIKENFEGIYIHIYIYIYQGGRLKLKRGNRERTMHDHYTRIYVIHLLCDQKRKKRVTDSFHYIKIIYKVQKIVHMQ